METSDSERGVYGTSVRGDECILPVRGFPVGLSGGGGWHRHV